MPRFIDFHTHKAYDDKDVVWVRSLLLKDQVLVKNYFTIGCHPWYIDNYNDYEAILRKYCQLEKCLGIGEIGLDRSTGNLLDQEKAFGAQLDLAKEFKKPVVIHCVRAYDLLLKYRKSYPSQTWIVHGFNGNLELARQLIDKGIYLSIGPALLNPQSKISKSFAQLPLGYVFLETDDIDFHIKGIYFAAAGVRNIPLHELQKIIIQNFKQVFDVEVE